MNKTDSFTYGSETVGGAAPTHQTEVLSHYMFVTTQDDAEFVVKFAVYASGLDALNTACQALEANLRMRYQRLSIAWASATNPVEVFDPSVSAGTFPSSGFDQEPNLRKLNDSEFPNSGLARGYEFRVRLAQYPNYTDAFGAAAGRRQVDVTEHYDADNRLLVTLSGEWTQVPGALARAQFLSQIDGASGYAAYRLSKVNATDAAATGATWTKIARDETDPNSLSTLRFSRTYAQHVNGRRASVVDVFFDSGSLRRVTIRGTYYRTQDGAGGAFGNVFGTAAGSLANFGAATTGGRGFAETVTTGQLATLTSAQGGALTYQSDCELLQQPTVSTNEQDDRTDYTLVYAELRQKQSNSANVLDDPNVFRDSMSLACVFTEVSDSPRVDPASSIPGPTGSSPSSGAENSSTLRSTERTPADPGKATGGSTVSPANVQKPVDVLVHYEAILLKTVSNAALYYAGVIEPLLLELLGTTFSFTGVTAPVELVNRSINPELQSNRVVADLHVRAYPGNLVLLDYAVALVNDTGVRVDAAFTGTPHEYYVQQALPKTRMTRRIQAVYRAGDGSFSLDSFKTPQALSGWVKLADSNPETRTKTLGIPALGVPQVQLTYATLEESFVWVARNVAQGGQSSSSGPSVATQSPAPVSPRIATGVDASGAALANGQ